MPEPFELAELRIGERVHVQGWLDGRVFTIEALNDEIATVRDVKAGRTYKVHTSRLLKTRWGGTRTSYCSRKEVFG